MDKEFRRTADLLDSGWTRASMDKALSEGTLTRLRRGLFSCCPAEESARPKILAGHRVCSDKAVLSHWSAAWLHDLPIANSDLRKVHLTRSRRSGARISPDLKLYACPILDEDMMVLNDLRVTTVARTVVDVSRHDNLRGWAVASGDYALRNGLTTRPELDDQLRRAARRPGIAKARRIVALLAAEAESPGESRSRWLMWQAGLPAPVLQAKVSVRGGQSHYFADFLWEEYGVIGEFDGEVKYGELAPDGSAWTALKAEKARHEALQAEGWIVVRWTWEELSNPVALLSKWRNAFLAARRLRERGGWKTAR